jgi:lipopolysaccharide biosynthesis regulator YciM
MEEYNIEGTSPLSTPVKSYYCYDCHLEMEVVDERDARCKKCGAPGHTLLMKCPDCKNSINVFHPDQLSDIHCFCNRR